MAGIRQGRDHAQVDGDVLVQGGQPEAVVGLPATRADQPEQAKVLVPAIAELLHAQHASHPAEPHRGLAGAPPQGRLQRQAGGGVGQHLAAAHGGKGQVLVEPAQHRVDAGRCHRRERHQLEPGRGVDRQQPRQLQRAPVHGDRRQRGVVAPRLKDARRVETCRAAPGHMQQQRA